MNTAKTLSILARKLPRVLRVSILAGTVCLTACASSEEPVDSAEGALSPVSPPESKDFGTRNGTFCNNAGSTMHNVAFTAEKLQNPELKATLAATVKEIHNKFMQQCLVMPDENMKCDDLRAENREFTELLQANGRLNVKVENARFFQIRKKLQDGFFECAGK